MADLVLAVSASHAPGLTGWIDRADDATRRSVEGAYGRIGQQIRDARLDVLVMVANDHLVNYDPGDYPDFAVGTDAEHTGPAEWFKPWLGVDDYRFTGHPDVARTLLDGLSGNGLRVVDRPQMLFDDNISVPVTVTGLTQGETPIVPIMQNCTVPPVPDQHASYEMGQRLGDVIREQLPAGMRVGLFGTGGMSHEPGGERYLEIDEAYDRDFLDLIERHQDDHAAFLEQATYERMEAAGAGGTAELLSWIAVMGAIGEKPVEVLCYACVPEWRCGVGAVSWTLETA